jgi:hypothetical protein
MVSKIATRWQPKSGSKPISQLGCLEFQWLHEAET